MKKDEEERIKKFNEVTDKHHKAMIKSLNEQAVRQNEKENVKKNEKENENDVRNEKENEVLDIPSEEIRNYIKENMDYPLTDKVYDVVDGEMEKLWNNMSAFEVFDEYLVFTKFKEAFVKAKILVPEDVTEDMTLILLEWLSEKGYIENN